MLQVFGSSRAVVGRRKERPLLKMSADASQAMKVERTIVVLLVSVQWDMFKANGSSAHV